MGFQNSATAADQREKAAENAAESLRKGDRVLITGHVHTEAWTDSDGATRTKQVITDTEIGASLRFSTVEVTRTKRDQQTTPS